MAAGKTIRKGLRALLDKISDVRKPIVGTRARRAHERARASSGTRVAPQRQSTADIANKRVRELAQKDQARLQADRDTAAGMLRRARGERKAVGAARGDREATTLHARRHSTWPVRPRRGVFELLGDPTPGDRARGRLSRTENRAQKRIDRATGRNAPQRKVGRNPPR